MPKFIDHHPIAHAPMTNEAVEALKGHIQAGKPDAFGVTLLNSFVAANGEGYCLSEAPNAKAVVEAHGARGYTIDEMDVLEVTSLV